MQLIRRSALVWLLALVACSGNGSGDAGFKSSDGVGGGFHLPSSGANGDGGEGAHGPGGEGASSGGWSLGTPSESCASPPAGALDVPAGHPRLWWTADRLAAARAGYQASPWTPDAEDPLELALHYVLSGDATSARAAIDALMDLDVPLSGSASDPYRWYGEAAIVTYDWCFDQMTDGERATIVARWNDIVAHWNAASWGGIGMEADNYYWGYLRNSLLWGMATLHENGKAQSFIDDALVTRYADSFLPYAAGEGRGGVSTEGTQYGRYLFGYPVIAFSSAANFGRPLFTETNYYCEAAYYLIYATTPDETKRTVGNNVVTGMDMFPFSDDEMFPHDALASSDQYAAFASAVATTWPDARVGRHARAWIQHAEAPVPRFVQAVDPGGESASFDSLPLDYYAPGPGYHYARTGWGPDATALNLQMGHPGRVGHGHLDAGNFQIWRRGRWLTRESTGYADTFVGYGGVPVGSETFSAHNVVAFQGRALAIGDGVDGPPRVVRLETQPDYAYAAVDLTDAYRSHDPDRPERDTPWAASVVREFLFVRPLETLVVFDRMLSRDAAGVAAADVVKASLVHFEQPPAVVDAQHVVGTNGDQALRLSTLVPSAPRYTVTAEGGVGQHRLDVETSGEAQSYFLHVLQAKDAAGADVDATVADEGDAFRVTLAHPTAGTAVVVLRKGAKSSGGSFGFAAGGQPAQTAPLRAGVQKIRVGKEGPYWAP